MPLEAARYRPCGSVTAAVRTVNEQGQGKRCPGPFCFSPLIGAGRLSGMKKLCLATPLALLPANVPALRKRKRLRLADGGGRKRRSCHSPGQPPP